VALVTLTTDFGVKDPFVGSMKGVILSICPEAVLVDLSHEIPRHSVAAAVYVLNQCLRYFPHGTVHLVVVDPGVGSARRPLACSAHGHYVVGPDNGLFGDLRQTDPASECFEIAGREFLLTSPSGSPTFQGRDVFAPAAAHLARGIPLSAFGPRISDPVRIRTAPATSGARGEIVWIDRFGNLISNLRPVGASENLVVEVMGREAPLVRHYEQAPKDFPAALVNSDQVVEVFVNRGDAAALLGATIGTPITLAKQTRSP
jgi:S-adenosylmethionine hydrolase